MRKRTGGGSTTPEGQRAQLVAVQKERFGGMKLGSAFFGWLTATGLAALLTALASAVGVAIATNADPTQITGDTMQTVGIISAVVLAIILFIAYFAGGYVAGRMARFDGVKQGIAVWLWAVLVAVVLAIVAAVAGSQFNVLSSLNTFPRIPVNQGALTTGGIISLLVAALIALVAAVLGGKVGMNFHRKVDQAGVDHRNGLER
ncbi:hypothetical protein ACH9DO_16430 [Kocuria sp. M1N1S27]|uniref:hypothetical protein n=1 Tax=Kocuria kalidii TaxID=3376283 RepID=UPI0037946352